jgi:hypothetical protein
MSFSVGIIGYPNVGKSTFFKALTKRQVEIAPRPFTTIHPNRGIVSVPDQRLEAIAKVVKPEKVTPTTIEFIDIAGLVKGAHQGQGLGNQFLAQIRGCDALLEVVRAFQDETIEHVEKRIDPLEDVEDIKVELLMKDLETIDKSLAKLEKRPDKQIQTKVQILRRIKGPVSKGQSISEVPLSLEQKEQIKDFQFLTEKPLVYILNIGDKSVEPQQNKINFLRINLKLEEELLELSEQEIQELGLESLLSRVILKCYQALDLITFYTIAGGKETKAWTLKKGSNASQAGATVHSDFEKLIKAEIIDYNKLIEAGSWKQAREKGLLKTVGRDYLVQDGEVIEFKI